MSDPGSAHTQAGRTPELPLTLTVTESVQDVMVAAHVRSLASMLLVPLLVVTAVPAAVAIAVGVVPVAVLFGLLGAGYALFLSVHTRTLVRRVFPVGRVLGAEVTPEHLAVSVTGGVEVHPWSHYAKARVTEDAVLLRVRRTNLTRITTQVLPRALFRPAALSVLESSVPRWS